METRLAPLFVAPWLAALIGCTAQVGGGDPTAAIQAIAVIASQAPPTNESTAALDPDAIVILVENAPPSCAAPYLRPWHDGTACASPDGSAWEAIVGVPPSKMQPGVISLDMPDAFAYTDAYWIDGDKCAGGSGGGLGGQMEILSIDATQVIVRFQGLPQGNSAGPGDDHLVLEGRTFTAARCP
jgi:hypothetical protein